MLLDPFRLAVRVSTLIRFALVSCVGNIVDNIGWPNIVKKASTEYFYGPTPVEGRLPRGCRRPQTQRGNVF